MSVEERAGEPPLPAAALAVFALAVALRAAWLARLGLQGDEDISTLAFRGILATGVPKLPSGNFYWRAPLYSYLAAPLAAFGIDWLPRVLSVLLSGATAWLLVRQGRRWVGRPAALVGGILFAVSLAEIHLARQARFYALYQLAAVLFTYALFRFTVTGAARWAAAMLATGLTAIGSHELGITLAVLCVLPLLRPVPRKTQGIAIGLLALLGSASWLRHHLAARSMTWGVLTVAERLGPIPSGLDQVWARAASSLHGGRLIALVVAVFVSGMLGWWAAADKGTLERGIAAAGAACTVALAGVGQVGAGFCGLVALALISGHLLPGRRGRRGLLILATILALVGAAHLAAGFAQGASLRHTIRDLGGGPLAVALGLLRPPAVAVPALLGAAWSVVATLQGKPWEGRHFLLLSMTILVGVRGLLAAKVEPRYMADGWPLWELMAGWTMVEGARRMAAPLRWVAVGAMVLAVLLLPGTAPAGTLSYLRREPGVPAAGVFPPMVPDLRGAARFVRAHASAGDRIAATDWLSTYCYVGRVDFWLRSDTWEQQAVLVEGVPRDIYLGARVVTTLAELEALRTQGPVWIVAGGLELYQETGKLEPALRRFLRESPAAWEGSDGWTRVLRLTPAAGGPRG